MDSSKRGTAAQRLLRAFKLELTQKHDLASNVGRMLLTAQLET